MSDAPAVVGRGAPVRGAAPASAVAALAAVERLVGHLLLGATARERDVERTFALADRAEAALARAVRLRDHAVALARRQPADVVVSPTWAALLATLDDPDPGGPTRLRAALAATVEPFLAGAYADVLAAADPLYDARLADTLRWCADRRTADDVDHGEGLDPVEPGGGGDGSATDLAAGLATAWAEAREGGPDADAGGVVLDAVAWPAVDRIPVPARPAGTVPLEPGALLELYETSRAEPENVRHTLHEAVLAECCALELMARTSYEHPELPWAFHLAAARHAADEARHGRIFGRLLAERGGAVGADGPVHTTLYSALYQFPPCDPGSPRELAWRLLLLCTTLEGLAIDQFAFETELWERLGEPALAQATSYVLADELFHAENGLRWTGRICAEHQMDPALERELAHAFFLHAQDLARQDYLAADPERAARELALLEAPDADLAGDADGEHDHLHSRTEVELRRRAGFSDHEIDQARRWAYHPEDEHLRNPGPRPRPLRA